MKPTAETLIDLLSERAEERPRWPLYTYLNADLTPRAELTLGALLADSRAIAARLQALGKPGDRALMIYPPGPEFVTAFFGCVAAGMVAVPVPAPTSGREQRALGRLASVVRDASPRWLLLPAAGAEVMTEALARTPALSSLQPVVTDLVAAEGNERWHPAGVSPHDLVYLQYTSGSTAEPRGVMLNHRHLLTNSLFLRQGFRFSPEATALWWTPHFHDDGLILGLLQPLYTGYRSYLMAPIDVVQKPGRWLEAISRYRASHSGGPNFIYALASRKVTPAEREGLDLSSWTMAYNAAEVVREETLRHFVATFEPYGFRSSALVPAYGLAEATLVVSTRREEDGEPILLGVERSALEARRVVAADGLTRGSVVLVGSGKPLLDTEVQIVDPDAGTLVPAGTVGEIWLASSSIAGGYWGLEEATERTFRAFLPDGRGPYLRTGDLGFLHAGELFVTGRVKDLIILHGRNLAPHDLERTAEDCHRALRAGCGIAFSVDDGQEERVVLVQEILPGAESEAEGMLNAIRQAVADEHQVALAAVVLIPAGALPKTSSGKLQRQRCRADFLAGRLRQVAAFHQSSLQARLAPNDSPHRRAQALEWLRGFAGRLDFDLMDERRGMPPQVLLELGNQGFFGLEVERRLGGLELGFGDALAVLEQLAAIDLSLAIMICGHNFLGLSTLVRHATSARRDELLEPLARGRMLAGFALSEPAAGSNPRALTATARRDQEGYRLRGTKWWTGNTAWGQVVVTFARLEPAAGVTAFLLRQGAAGVRVGAESRTLGLRAMVQSALHLEDAWASEADVLGQPGEGLVVAGEAMELVRVCLVAAAIGAMKRCLELALRYTRRRSIATGRLLDNPATRVKLNHTVQAIRALEAIRDWWVERREQGLAIAGPASALAKVAASELLWQAADDTLQLLGGRGYDESNGAARLLRDARVFRIFEGPTEALLPYVGASVLHDEPALSELFGSSPGGRERWCELRAAAKLIDARLRSPHAPFADRPAAHSWAQAQVGTLALEALLVAALARTADAPAQRWAESRWRETYRRTVEGSVEEVGQLDVAALEEAIDSFTAKVGLVERAAGGEGHGADPLLVATPDSPEPVTVVDPVASAVEPTLGDSALAERKIRNWLVAWIAREVGLSEAEVNTRAPFAPQGVDSVTGARLAAELGEWLGRPLPATLVWDHTSIDQVATWLVAAPSAAAAPPVVAPTETGLERLLAEIEELSEEEAARVLATEGREGG